MAKFWQNRDDLPEELRNMDPKDIVEMVKKGREAETKITELTTSLQTTSTAFETYKTDVDGKLNDLTTKLREVGERGNNNNNNNNNNNRETQLTDFLVDPDKATQERIGIALTPLTGVVIQQGAYTAKNAARERMQRLQRANPGKVYDGYFFEKFETEIDALAAKMPAVQLTNPETWEHLYYNIKGRHADEIAAQVKEGKAEFLIDPGTSTRRQDDNTGDTRLTDQQLRIAAKLGQTPEQYMEQQKKINSSLVGVNV